MLQKYVIYFSLKDTCDVTFSPMFSSFNSAKESIKTFVDKYANDRGKKTIVVSKEELEKLKSVKIPEDCLYVRRKNSEAIVYHVSVSTGRIYNSYSLEKLGKVGITEFIIPFQKDEPVINETKLYDTHVTNYERGTHVSFVSELKNVLLNRQKNKFSENINKKEKEQNPFILSLIEGKTKLKNVGSPVIQKHI